MTKAERSVLMEHLKETIFSLTELKAHIRGETPYDTKARHLCNHCIYEADVAILRFTETSKT